MNLSNYQTRQTIKRSFIFALIKPVLNFFWIIKGRPVPPPHFIKVNKILSLSKLHHIDTLIETGTFRGDTVFATKKYFKKVISIELDDILFKKALAMFANDPGVTILKGNSEEILPKLLIDINQPCTFWLDGHYSGPGTSSGLKETPILAELFGVINHPQRHVILIDDARCFVGSGDYPSIGQLKNLLLSNNKNYTLSVEDDIIIIV